MFNLSIHFGNHDEPRPEPTTPSPISSRKYSRLEASLLSPPFNSDRDLILHSALADVTVTADQGRRLIATYSFISGPVEAAKWLVINDKISDLHNIADLVKDLASWNAREVLCA
jgi:hypothetical protein